jgi:hypothetical protein
MANAEGARMTRTLGWVVLTLIGCGARTEDAPSAPVSRTGAFIAVGADGAIVLSDATASRWEAVSSGTTQRLTAVAVGPQRIVAVGAAGTVIVSVDGRAWTAVDTGAKCDLNDVAWTGNRFVAIGGDWSNGSCGVHSNDGSVWTSLKDAPSGEMAQAVAVIDGTVVVSAYGRSDLMWPALFRIVGDAWQAIDITGADRSVVFRGSANVDGTTYVAASNVAEVTSVMPWTQRALSPEPSIIAWDIAAGDDKLVVVGENGGALRRDGSWTRVLESKGALWTSVTHGAGRFVAVGQKGRVATSIDGVAWTETTAGAADLRAVAHLSEVGFF